MKRILITGIAGFIGSNLADRLLRERETMEIIGVDNLAYGIKEQIPEGVRFHQMDIRSWEIFPLFKGADCVFHLAAKNCIADCQNDPQETADINVRGTVNVFEAAKRAGVPKVIYAESSALYEGSRIFPTPESEVKPESFYAISKMAGMSFAKAYRKFFQLNSTALRYFCVYGPRQDYRRTIPPVMSAFVIKLLKNEPLVIYGTGEKRRDFVHVDDVNDFHLLCMRDSRTDGKTFNIGSGRNYSVQEICGILSDLMGTSRKPVYQGDLPGEAQETLADISQAKGLGWSPKIDIKTGLKGMIRFIQEEITAGRISKA